MKQSQKPYIEALILLAIAFFAARAHADQPVHMSCMSRDTKTQLVADFVVMGDGIARGSIQRLNGGQNLYVNKQQASISYSLHGNRQTLMNFRPSSGLSGVTKATLTLPGNLESGTVTTGAARLTVQGSGKNTVSTVNCQLAQM